MVGQSFLLTVRDGETLHTIKVRNGKAISSRPGDRETWRDDASRPPGDEIQVIVFPATWGQAGFHYDGCREFMASGLPAAPDGQRWTVAPDERLCLLPLGETVPGRAWLSALEARTQDHNGWVFLRDAASEMPEQAIRFTNGHQQWIVPVDPDGTAHRPETLDAVNPRWGDADPETIRMAGRCTVLSSDYTRAGGDVPRYLEARSSDSDCASGCRWFRALDGLDPRIAEEWGLCTSPRSPRRGLLTWQHQAGQGCFEEGTVSMPGPSCAIRRMVAA